MGTVTKTLKLLDYFSNERPEIGLTQFTRLSGYDKATSHRRLTELVSSGFLEQDVKSRGYRLGPAILRLANVREQTFPAKACAMPILRKLSTSTQETVHISLIQGQEGLGTLAHLDSTAHGMRVYIDESELLPFHATASGVVALAFSDDSLLEHVLSQPFTAYTNDTITTGDQLVKLVSASKASGIGTSDGGFDDQVVGLAAPLFDNHGRCNGAVAIATPSTRLTKEIIEQYKALLKQAASDITLSWGGRVPLDITKAWAT